MNRFNAYSNSSPITSQNLTHNPYVDSFPQTNMSPYGSNLTLQHSLKPKHQPKYPIRTTRLNKKAVFFPQKSEHLIEVVDQKPDDLLNSPLEIETARTVAEKMSKDHRFVLPRVTSYCVADGYKLDSITEWIRSAHNITPKVYDECLYVCYLPHGNWTGQTSFKKMTITLYKGNDLESINPQYITESNDAESWMFKKEVFIFDYGVVVFYNFSLEEELRYLESISSYTLNPLNPDDIENESLHFQYDLSGPLQPRIFNDMITLKTGNPLIKLTISHAVAQSTKLLRFENIIEFTISGAIPLPRMMAKYGEVQIPRVEVMKIVGKLFQLKMNVNLISNVLDAPEIFWSEIELEAFYSAIRGYMEISQRVSVLNKKADVISDLLDMLSDHTNSNQMNYITWIIILMIAIAVVVALIEVYVKSWQLSG